MLRKLESEFLVDGQWWEGKVFVFLDFGRRVC